MGKTTLAAELARRNKDAGRPVIVLDPMESPRWNADFITDNPAQFLEVVFKNTGCALFIDESGETIGRFAGEMKKVATRSAQFGHDACFISQRAQDVDRTVRDQCTNIFLFRSALDDGILLAKSFVADGFKKCHELLKGEYLYKTENMYEVKRSRIF